MAELTPEQRAFLAASGIPLSLVFDASGMGPSRYKKVMEENSTLFAIGVSRCKRWHESIRTRYGHCIQCNPVAIAIVMREDSPANVYIAGSRHAALLKVGLSTDLKFRVRNLNIEGWADRFDWQLLAFAHCNQAGRVERNAQGLLGKWGASCHYKQGGRKHHSYEVFRCNFADARDAVQNSLPAGTVLNVPNAHEAETNYKFR